MTGCACAEFTLLIHLSSHLIVKIGWALWELYSECCLCLSENVLRNNSDTQCIRLLSGGAPSM